MAEKLPIYIDGVGWRYDIEHHQKRRCRTHHYSNVGTYLVTLVVDGRMPVFGSLEGSVKARKGSEVYPHIVPSQLGRLVVEEELPKIHRAYPMVEIWMPFCLMPDHIHIMVRINSPLPEGKHLGQIVGAFKGGISRAWWRMQQPSEGSGSSPQPLFEEGYNDRILKRNDQLQHWKEYLRENPFRALMRREQPELMQRALCLTIAGVRYGAFGNFTLLRHPEKHQVFFHRKTMDDGRMVPTEHTAFWQQEHASIMLRAIDGDVHVTPGISECEKRIKNELIEKRLRLIHLQKEPIGNYWKPERERFYACAAGTLLILAPWAEDLGGECDYERFHKMNDLAATICAIDTSTECRVKEAGKANG